MIDEMPVYVPSAPVSTSPTDPTASKPRLGPGAPPVPPYRSIGETPADFIKRLRKYNRALLNWTPTYGWSERDRDGFLAQVGEYISWFTNAQNVSP